MTANEFFKNEIQKLFDKGQTWTRRHNRPWGTIYLPPETLIVEEPIELPLRVNVVGTESYLRGIDNLIVAPDWPKGVPMLKWERSRSQGGFSNVVRELSLNCRGRSSGLLVNGDQESSYERIRIVGVGHDSYGIWADDISHAAHLDKIYVEGLKYTNATGIKLGGRTTGGKLRPVHGLLTACHVHNCGVGINREYCFSIYDIGTAFEHVVVPYITKNCQDISSLGVRIGYNCAPSDGVISVLDKVTHYTLQGSARKNKTNVLKVKTGSKLPLLRYSTLTTKGKSNNPKGFEYSQ